MLRFIFTRLSLVVPTFIGITLLVFVLVRLIPGDPIETMAGERGIDLSRVTASGPHGRIVARDTAAGRRSGASSERSPDLPQPGCRQRALIACTVVGMSG